MAFWLECTPMIRLKYNHEKKKLPKSIIPYKILLELEPKPKLSAISLSHRLTYELIASKRRIRTIFWKSSNLTENRDKCKNKIKCYIKHMNKIQKKKINLVHQ